VVGADLFDGRSLRVAEDEALGVGISLDEGVCPNAGRESELDDSDAEFHADRTIIQI
jgi:hypothetical protein